MNEIIKITEVDGRQVVSARELYAFLDIQTPFTMWAERMFEYGFSENIDYVSLSQKSEKPQGGRPQLDYALTIDCAKEISMIQRNEKGKQARQYFIEAEKKFRAMQLGGGGFQIPQSFSEALMLAAKQAEEIEKQQKQLKEQAPKVLFSDAVATSTKSCLIRELAKLIKQNGVDTGENRLYAWLRNNGYLCKFGESYNQPPQKAMEMGLFEIKKTSITKPSRDILVTTTTKVTGKGQIYFVNKFLNRK